jgi:sec-independent protein translocase protein TatA
MPFIGWGELLLILIIILLLFGSRKLPELARSLGLSVGEFKKGMKEPPAEEKKESK